LGSEVHLLTKKSYSDLLILNPNIDKLFLYEDDLNLTIQDLKKEKYDYIFDLHNNLRSWIIKWKLQIPSRSLSKNNFHKWLMVKFNKKIVIPHIIKRYLQTIDPDFDADYDDKMDFFYKPDNSLKENFNLPDSYYCISMGAKHYTKRMPTELISKILSQIDHRAVLIGGIDSENEGFSLAEEYADKVFNLCGKLTLWQSAQIIDNSVLLLTSDTGMMHLAAALGKETHVVWGNTVPEFGMFAYYGKNISKTYNYEVKVACRPCSRIGFDKCPKKHFNCMKKQDHKLIIHTIMSTFAEIDRN
jgi:heptosyltransferase-2